MAKNDVDVRITAKDLATGSIRRVKSALNTLTGPAAKITAGLAAVAGVGGIGALVKSSLDAQDKIGKMADRLNISTESLSAFQHMSGLAGISVDNSNQLLQTFGRVIGEAANGTGEAVGELQRLNIDARELVKLPLDKAFEKVSESVGGVENKFQQTAIASKIFGEQGGQLVNVMQNGSTAFNDAKKEVGEFGIALSRVEIKRIENANDSIYRLKKIFSGFGNLLAVELSGPIQTVVEWFTKTIREAGGARVVIDHFVTTVVHGMATVLEVAGAMINAIDAFPGASSFGVIGYLLFGKRGAAVGALVGFALDSMEKLGDVCARIKQAITDIGAELGKLFDKFVDTFSKSEKGSSKLGENLIQLGVNLRKTHQYEGDTIEETFRRVQEVNNQLTDTQRAQYDQQLANLNSYLGDRTDQINNQINNQLDLVTRANEFDILSSAKTSEYIIALERKRTTELRKEASRRLIAKTQEARGTISTISGMTSAAAQEDRKSFEINKAANIANAIIDTYAGMARALQWGWPLGPIFAAIIGYAGFQNVNAIRRQQFGGGGAAASVSSSVPTPSIPSTPTIPSNLGSSQSSQQQVAQPPQTTVVIKDSNPFFKVWIREIFAPAINEASRDGFRFEFE